MAIDAQSFKQAMRQCAGAVALVTVGTRPGRRTGLTVTSACSLSDDPPSLLVCVNRNASAHTRIREEGHFVINFLNEEHALLALTFSGQKGVNGDDRFAFGRLDCRRDGRAGAARCRRSVRLRIDAGVGDQNPFRLSRRGPPRGHLRRNRSTGLSPQWFHGVRDVRDTVSLGDLDARRTSWSEFS